MPVSQHSHSGQFCRHGTGTLEQVVLAAISQGMVAYALTEHVPRYSLDYRYPEELDMTVNDLQRQFHQFLVEARRLQIKYEEEIDVVIGFESEYITPHDVECMLADIVAQHTSKPPLLIVGSVHHVRTIPIDFSPPRYQDALAQFDGDYVAMYCAYFDAQLSMFESVRPHVIGHFDLVGIYAPSPEFHLSVLHDDAVMRKIVRNITWVIANHALLEINVRGWYKGLPGYPHQDLAKTLVDMFPDLLFTVSDDAHGPEGVGWEYKKYLPMYIKEIGIDTVYYFNSRIERVPISVSGKVWTQYFSC